MKLAVKTSALLLAALLGLVDSQMYFPSRPQRNRDENSDEVIFPKPTNFPRRSVVFPQPAVSLQGFLEANGQIGQAPRQSNTEQFGNNQGVTIIRQPGNFRLVENGKTPPVIRQPNRQQQGLGGQGFAGTQQPISNIQIGSIVTPFPQQFNPQFGNSQISPGIGESFREVLQPERRQETGSGQGFTGTQQPRRPQTSGNGQGFTGTQQPSRNQLSESGQGFTGTQQPRRPQTSGNGQGFTGTQQPSRNQLSESGQGFTGTQQPRRPQTSESGQGFTGTQQPSRPQTSESGQGFTGTQQPSRPQTSESGQGFTGTQQPSRPQHAENDRVTPVSQPNIPNFQPGRADKEFIPGQSGGSPSRRRHHLCGVKPTPGECRGAFPRFYYNPETDQCDCFVYGGCGQEGLESSYKTLEDCHRTCLPSSLQEGPTCNTVFADEQKVFHHKPPPIQPNPTFFHDSLTADQFLKQALFRFK
ncbi:uncharacterized protein [Procambarus clarkii]|uniref:uncharacterized protein n=1 Tax=Procambarus clarkii TaxID=6728 RepID=UPI001E67140C|nr:glutenin, high molecular weight subunit PW212-like [Procambarus clarkii]